MAFLNWFKKNTEHQKIDGVDEKTNEPRLNEDTQLQLNSDNETLRLQLIEGYVFNELREDEIKMESTIYEAETELNDDNDDLGSNIVDLSNRDKLFDDCARLVVQMQSGSPSNLQRRLNLGYNRAGRIMDQLEAAGIVGPFNGSRPRDVYFKTENELEEFLGTIPDGSKKYSSLKTFPNNFYEENKNEIDPKIIEGRKKIQEETTRRLNIIEKLKEEKFFAEKEKIKKKLLEKERKKQLHKDVFKELVDEGQISSSFIGNNEKREIIPQDVMDRVWNRDGGKCVKCGSQENLEFDHIIPHSKGGAASYRNLQILCKKCNVEKSNKIG